jgi:chlorite dismutase
MSLEEAEELMEEIKRFFEIADLFGNNDGTWSVTIYRDYELRRGFDSFDEWIRYVEAREHTERLNNFFSGQSIDLQELLNRKDSHHDRIIE